jgi:ArsR family metal-binding transcriptional regulator
VTDLFLLKLCTDGAAYEVRPRKQTKLDLPAISEELASMTKMRIRVSLPAILILEDDDHSVTIYPSGKLLLRKFPSEESAKQIALLLSPKLYASTT